MAENNPMTPGGALPPRPAEASKVQPKKETVRINLPPKPTSAPTIKLPTLAPGAPAHSPTSVPTATVVAAPALASAKAPAAPTPPAGAAGTRVAAPATAAKPAAPAAAAPRPMAAPAAAGLKGLDKALIYAAAVASLAALGCVLYLAFFLKDNPPS